MKSPRCGSNSARSIAPTVRTCRDGCRGLFRTNHRTKPPLIPAVALLGQDVTPPQNPPEVFQPPARPASAPVDDIIRMAYGVTGVGLILGALIVAKAFHVLEVPGCSARVVLRAGHTII